jgi:hypothetical protein
VSPRSRFAIGNRLPYRSPSFAVRQCPVKSAGKKKINGKVIGRRQEIFSFFFFFGFGNPMPSVYHWRHHDSHNADLFAQYFFFAK